MSVSVIVFYIISFLILGCGLLAVTSRKIFRSAIYLLGSLVSIAALYFWMEMEFIAAVQIVVYVGGIVVLIIFSVFLTQQAGKEMLPTPVKRIIAAAVATIAGLGLALTVIYHYGFAIRSISFDSSVERIGTAMLGTGAGGYALPFELVSILLLAAMIGAIVIALKSNPEEK